MSIDENRIVSLEEMSADRRLVDGLAAHGLLSPEAYDSSLRFIHPERDWGFWTTRFLFGNGLLLILSGIVTFFAYNWALITPFVKLSAIQAMLLACLCGAFLSNQSEGIARRGWLLMSSILVGVFFAVFGQIYQTGADSYLLFLLWGIFILPWVLLSAFSLLWFVWLGIANTTLILYWFQAANPGAGMTELIYPILAVFNGTVLIIGEQAGMGLGIRWLNPRWLRNVLAGTVIIVLFVPTVALLADFIKLNPSIRLTVILCAVTHPLIYCVYRFRVRDVVPVVVTIISFCLLIEAAFVRCITEIPGRANGGVMIFIGIVTLVFFFAGSMEVRRVVRRMEESNE